MQKIDKKILIMLVVILIAVLSAGFFVFKYLKEIKTVPQDSALQESLEKEEKADEDFELLPSEEEQPSIDAGSLQIETEQQAGLFICVDKCGDNICQASDPECKNNMNCVCLETKEECPKDCK